MVSRGSSVFLIGGYCDGQASALIAKYTKDEWAVAGYLQRGRGELRAIANGDRLYMIGGGPRWTLGNLGVVDP